MVKMKRPLYREIAAILQAIRNCEKDENQPHPWITKHEDRLKEVLGNLPHGSGIDNGVELEWGQCKSNKMVFSFGYHHMNEAGMYDGWTDHNLIVTPSFDGIDLNITGKDRNQIKEYLYDTFHYALTEEVEIS